MIDRMSRRATLGKRGFTVIARVAVIAILATLLACSDGDNGQGAAPPTSSDTVPVTRGGTLVVGETFASNATTNVASSTGGGTHAWWETMYNGLIALDERGNPLPELATPVPSVDNGGITNGGATYTLRLRSGVKWHDGTDFTANDVKFTFEKVLLKFHARARNMATPLGYNATTCRADNIVVVDPTTVRFNFTAPYIPFIKQLNVTEAAMNPAGALPAFPTGADGCPSQAEVDAIKIGTGPFKFDSIDTPQAGDGKVVKNPNYWQPELPYLDGILMRPYTADAARFSALSNGEVDFIWDVPNPNVSALSANSAFKTAATQSLGGGPNSVDQVIFNLKASGSSVATVANGTAPDHPILGNVNVRKAIFQALNRTEFLNAGRNGIGTVGVAPGITLMAVKFIDEGSFCGSDAMAIDAIDYAASFGVHIINASWGGSSYNTLLETAIAESGALVVAAAGNYNEDIDQPGGQFYPASFTLANVVSVAAVDQKGKRAVFSNYGDVGVDISAPGTNILSTYPASADCASPCYAWAEGTSMAAPHVTGVAALAASAHPSLLADPLRLRRRLLDTGQGLPGGTGWSVTGRMVNAFRAVDAAPPVALAPDRFAARTGAVVSAREVPVVVAWPAATDAATSVIDYDLRRAGPTGWSTVAERRATTSASSRLRFGSAYRFRVTARDEPGNTSVAADSRTVTASLHPDGSSLARYRSGWRTVASSSALGGKLHTTSRAGTSLSFSFNGRSFALIGTRGPSRGKIEVWVDGALARTVDLRRASTQSRVVVFSTAWTTKAAHAVRIVVVGSRRVDIDGFVVVR